MRRYDIVSGILFIFSIIDFALAAPVLVQEKRQGGVDALDIPKDVITVFGKRGDEELARLLDQHLNAIGNPAESSDAHAWTGSQEEHVQQPNPRPSIPIFESSEVYASSSFAPPGPVRGSTSTNVAQAHGGFNPLKPPILESSEMHPSSSFAPPGPVRGSTSTNVVQAPASYTNPNWLLEPSGPSGAAPMRGS